MVLSAVGNVPDPVRYAGFWRRLVADIINNILLLPILSLILPASRWSGVLKAATLPFGHLHTPTTYGIQSPIPAPLPSFASLVAPLTAHPAEQLLTTLITVTYTIVFWMRYMGTPGKLLMRCHLVDAQTFRPVTFRQSVLRNIGYLVSWGTLGLGFLWIAWDRRKQGFHDKIAGTVVLYVGPIHKGQGA